jgi:choline monooxygenase
MDLNDYTPQPDLSRATTLPARWYADPAFLPLEKEKIFWHTWQPVGYVDRVAKPGDFFACDIAGEPIAVVRDAAGTLRALSNVCRHRASTIACGQGNCATLRCPHPPVLCRRSEAHNWRQRCQPPPRSLFFA